MSGVEPAEGQGEQGPRPSGMPTPETPPFILLSHDFQQPLLFSSTSPARTAVMSPLLEGKENWGCCDMVLNRGAGGTC